MLTVLRMLKKIESLSAQNNFVDTVRFVRDHYADFCIKGSHSYRTLINRRFMLKLLHSGFRRQPCLYLTLLGLAQYTSLGETVEVNAGISLGDNSITDGHCWLSKSGVPLAETMTKDIYSYDECLAEKDKIRYWIRRNSTEIKK